jgi:hypothetical protein
MGSTSLPLNWKNWVELPHLPKYWDDLTVICYALRRLGWQRKIQIAFDLKNGNFQESSTG